MCLVKPGVFQVFRNFEGTVYILKESEGGRHKPFTTGYTPQCFLRTADVAVVMDIGEGKMAMPGDNLSGKFSPPSLFLLLSLSFLILLDVRLRVAWNVRDHPCCYRLPSFSEREPISYLNRQWKMKLEFP